MRRFRSARQPVGSACLRGRFESLCIDCGSFYEAGFKGKLAEWDLSTQALVRTVELTSEDDGPTSPRFPPTWYQGRLVASDEYLLADFGGDKATGGVWKWGSALATPVRLYDTQAPPEINRVWALSFTTDRVLAFVTQTRDGEICGQLCEFDGRGM